MVLYCTTDPSDAPEKDRDCVSLVDPVPRRSELLLLSGRGARGSRCRCTEECDFCEDGRMRLLRERRLCMEFALWLAEDPREPFKLSVYQSPEDRLYLWEDLIPVARALGLHV